MMRKIFPSLLRRTEGAAAIEFALLGPAFFVMFLGVMQVGIGMQNYNAMRGISGDVARYAVVNYQTGARPNVAAMETWAENRADGAPYGLAAARFNATITAVTPSRVTGASEYSIVLTYTVPTVLGMVGIGDIPLTYTRPVFVVTS